MSQRSWLPTVASRCTKAAFNWSTYLGSYARITVHVSFEADLLSWGGRAKLCWCWCWYLISCSVQALLLHLQLSACFRYLVEIFDCSVYIPHLNPPFWSSSRIRGKFSPAVCQTAARPKEQASTVPNGANSCWYRCVIMHMPSHRVNLQILLGIACSVRQGKIQSYCLLGPKYVFNRAEQVF